MYLQLQLQQLLWPGQSVALSAPALSNKFSRATVEIGEEGERGLCKWTEWRRLEKNSCSTAIASFPSLSHPGQAFKVDFDDVLKLFNFLPR